MLKRADTPHGGRFDRGDDSECSPRQLNMSNNSSIVLNELYEGKQSFFVPPTLKPRCAGFRRFFGDKIINEYFSEQFLPEIRKQHIRLPFFIEALLDKCRQFPLIQTPIVSSYETLCTLLAVNCAIPSRLNQSNLTLFPTPSPHQRNHPLVGGGPVRRCAKGPEVVLVLAGTPLHCHRLLCPGQRGLPCQFCFKNPQQSWTLREPATPESTGT
jgi:hypothetical protein